MGQPNHLRDDPAETRRVTPIARWSPAVRRSYPRFSVGCAIVLQPESSDACIKGTTVNISRGGALVRTAYRLDETKRHLLLFLPDESTHSFAAQTCPACGHMFATGHLHRLSVWARILRQGRGGGGTGNWAAAMEFETLIDMDEDDEQRRETP